MIRILSHIRSPIGLIVATLITIFFSLVVMTFGALGLQAMATKSMRCWAWISLSVFGIYVVTKGAQYLPEDGGGIMVFNHQSHFDIPALILSTPKHIRFGAKIELFKIPFFGRAMRNVGTLPIARDNRTEVLKIYKEAEERFRENTIFVLAPEGTRQKEPLLGRFKKGPFVFAISAQVPIIPCVIKGAHAVLPKNSLGVNLGAFWSKIEIEILPPFPTRGMAPTDVSMLLDRTREVMNDSFSRAK